MSIHHSAQTFADARIVKRLKPLATTVNRSFDLPPVLHAVTVGLYVAFLAVMALAFPNRELIIPMAIFVIYIVMAFGVPALWVHMKPEHASKTLHWADFHHFGIRTHTGTLTAKDATIQVLILPTFILGWGAAIALMAAIVR